MSGNADNADMSWYIGNDDVQLRSRMLLIIYNFYRWQWIYVLSYKTYSLAVYYFIVVNMQAHMYPLTVHGNRELATTFPS